jgi:hypothetical protein
MKQYLIKKKMKNQSTGKVQHVLLTDGSSQIWELTDKENAEEIVRVLNANTDSGCEYELITTGH